MARVGASGGTVGALLRQSRPAVGQLAPRLGLLRCVGQALATEPIPECIGSGGVGETESNIGLFGVVPTPATADWDASFGVERVKL